MELKYEAGSIDLLSILQLQNAEIATQHELIKLRYEQLANFINLHLALGGSFDWIVCFYKSKTRCLRKEYL